MECPYCREVIKEGATKCKECGELLSRRRRLRSLIVVLSAALTVLVPLASLFIAYVEIGAKNSAVDAKNEALDEKAVVEKDIQLGLQAVEISQTISETDSVQEAINNLLSDLAFARNELERTQRAAEANEPTVEPLPSAGSMRNA